eukprot:gene4932-47752_t
MGAQAVRTSAEEAGKHYAALEPGFDARMRLSTPTRQRAPPPPPPPAGAASAELAAMLELSRNQLAITGAL